MRVLSGIQPTGQAHIGNYFGAIKSWVAQQELQDSYFTVVDLHAITIEHDPKELYLGTLELFATLLAAGLDQDKCTLFVQSHVAAHANLAWLMECTVSMGELNRMTQFKDKGRGSESVRAGLFTYPALMAADVLLYQADKVPVGDDQKQHLELTRDLAMRFNRLYGEVFTVPEPSIPTIGARIMDLSNPTKKMSKSSSSPAGIIYLLEPADQIKKKISKAVTDTDNCVEYDPQNRSGISNLLEIFGVATGKDPRSIAQSYSSYGALKNDLTEVLVTNLTPIRARLNNLLDDKAELARLMRMGAEKAEITANETLRRAQDAVGFVPRSQ